MPHKTKSSKPHLNSDGVPIRILAVSAHWQGPSDYGFVRAFRRTGHSVQVVADKDFIPSWRSLLLRGLRRLLRNQLVLEYNERILEVARQLRPDLFFVFKGPYVQAETVQCIKSNGTVCIQFFPDVSFRAHGPFLPHTLSHYDWVFTTKSFGLSDMEEQLGIRNASFLPHGFDPETHFPVGYSDDEEIRYGCDAAFVGNWSPKKQELLQKVVDELPEITLKIWGPDAWSKVGGTLGAAYQRQSVLGLEYAKAIQLSKINIGLLSEAGKGASRGDQTTTRTFEIPAARGFMLHERTAEAEQFFEEDRDCAFFSTPDELISKIRYYLYHEQERQAIAAAGRRRSLRSGYSVEERAGAVLEKYFQLRAAHGLGQSA